MSHLSRRQGHLFWTEIWVVLSNFARPALDDCIAEHCDDHHKQEVAGVHEVQVNERAIVIWNDDSELGIQCVIHLPNGTFVTPERVVLLCVLSFWISCCSENLVPGCGIAVGLRDTVRWLHCDWEDITGCCDGHTGAEDHLLTTTMQNTLIWVPGYRQSECDVHLFMGLSASKANLLPKHTGIKVGNIAWVAPKWPQWIQGQCDGHRDVDRPWVLQQGWWLGAGSRLTAGHCALWSDGLVQVVLEGLVFWDAKVKLIESEKKRVPILCHFRWFDFLDLKEVSYSEESDSHSTDADHKNDQRRTVTYVGL